MQDRPSTSSNRASLSRRQLLEGDERACWAAAAPRADLWGLSVLGRFNSLIVGFVSLLVGLISLFGRVGNLRSDIS
jgi:hypothetical protein